MKPLLFLFLVTVMPLVLFAQSLVFPKFERTVWSVGDLIPRRWHIKDSVSGDLNKDGCADLALVLEYADTITEMRPVGGENTDHPRILLVLFRDTATGGYRPVCQNNTFIIREGEGGMLDDPYGSLSITNNILTVNIEFLRETAEYKFRWQKGDFYLIGASDYSAMAATGSSEGWEFNFSTNKAKHTRKKGGSSKEQVEWKTFLHRAIRLRDLRQYGAIEIFESVSI